MIGEQFKQLLKLEDFETPTHPVVVGHVATPEQFSRSHLALFVYLDGTITAEYASLYTGISMARGRVQIPRALSPFADIIETVVEDAQDYGINVQKSSIGLALRQGTVRRNGDNLGSACELHIDADIDKHKKAASKGRLKNFCLYNVYDSIDTEYFPFAMKFEAALKERIVASKYETMDAEIHKKLHDTFNKAVSPVTFAPYAIVRYDSTTPHRARVPQESGQRTFLQMVLQPR